MSWRDSAACRDATHVDWFPEWDYRDRRQGEWRANLERAREVCAGCEVRVQCLAAAMADPLTAGIWAGTTESQRRRSPQPPRRPQVARCGTDSGYYHHLRKTGTEPCRECREAHAIAHRIRKHQLAVVR